MVGDIERLLQELSRLVAMKLAADRPRDREDIEALLALRNGE
jgi:hypothetical protein